MRMEKRRVVERWKGRSHDEPDLTGLPEPQRLSRVIEHFAPMFGEDAADVSVVSTSVTGAVLTAKVMSNETGRSFVVGIESEKAQMTLDG